VKTWLRIALVGFVLWLVCAGAGLAQEADSPATSTPLPDQNLRFEHLTVEDGLSEGRIWGLTQDSRGFMWFASWDGLNRFDGYEFKVYRHDPDDPSSPPATQFKRAYEDSSGILWFGTWGEGLVRFDPVTEQWRGYRNDPDDPHSLSSDAIWAIHQDSSNQLWIGTEGGLDRFDPVSEQFVHYRHDPADPDSLSDSAVLSILEDSSGILWIGTFSGGLNRYDPESGRFTHYVHDPNNPQSLSGRQVYCIYEDREGMLWLGFWEDTLTGGLDRFDPKTGQVTRYANDSDDPSNLSSNIVTAIHQDDSGALWVATYGGGLNRLDLETQRFAHFSFDPNDASSLGHANALAIHQDRASMLWIGTGGGGVSILDLERKPFSLYQHQASDPNSLVANDVRSILEDSSGDLWVGTAGSGLTRLDRETGQATHFEYTPYDPKGLRGSTVTALVEDQSGAIWIGMLDGGLDRFDKQTETFTHYPHDRNDPHSLSYDDVNVILEDRSGVLWVGTYSGGLNALDHETNRFTHYQHDPNDPHSLSSNAVMSLHEDSAGTLWIGTVGGGLNRLGPAETEGEKARFVRYLYNPDDRRSLSNNSVYTIHEDRNGTLWVGTADGLNRFEPQAGQFARYSEKDGLPSGFINAVLEDPQGYLWLSTSNGLSRFNPQTEQFRNYSEGDGLQGDQFNYRAAYGGSTGELFFGGPNGLTAFYPDQIEDSPHVPPVFITGLQLNYEPVRVDAEGVLPRSLLETEALSFGPEHRVLSFQFSALNYRAPEKSRYRYMLEGFDDAWQEVDSTQRSATYTNLDAGQYTFRVAGSNSDGLWNEEGASLRIIVTPPWWGTWWFRGGLLLLLVALLAGGFVLQRKGAERRQRHLEVIVAERTHELDERVKELDCLYGISRLAGQQNISLEEILQGTVQLIPPAMQYPQATCARITVSGQEYKTDNFEELPWQQAADIVVRARRDGSVEVGYLEQRPEQDEGPFLTEEIDLLNAIAERLGRIVERKRAEEQIRFQAHMLASIEQAVVATDPVGHVVYWNPYAERLFGWSAEEAVGTRTREFFLIPGGQARQRDAEVMASLRDSGSWSGEYLARRRDGSHVPVQSGITTLTDDAGEPTLFIGTMSDITDRKQAEEALRSSEEEHRALSTRLQTLLEVSYDLSTSSELPTLLNRALRQLHRVVDFDRAGVMLVDEEDVLSTYSFYAPDWPSGLTTMQIPVTRLPAFQQIFEQRQAVYEPDLHAGQDSLQAFDQVADEHWSAAMTDMQTWLGTPLVIRNQVIGVLSLLHGEPDSYDKSLRDLVQTFANQLAIAIENVNLLVQAEEAATLEERTRLARELHDSVTQSLYSITLHTDATLLAMAAGKTGVVQERLQRLKARARDAMTEMRLLIYQLRPSILSQAGLAAALEARLQAVEARSGLKTELQTVGDRRLPQEVEAELFWVALEGLNNVLKHARASEVYLRLELGADLVTMMVQDNGIGFDPTSTDQVGGYGLATMEERMQRIDGKLEIETAPGAGTTLCVEVKV
jgi:PAS domain S-box-containing protein